MEKVIKVVVNEQDLRLSDHFRLDEFGIVDRDVPKEDRIVVEPPQPMVVGLELLRSLVNAHFGYDFKNGPIAIIVNEHARNEEYKVKMRNNGYNPAESGEHDIKNGAVAVDIHFYDTLNRTYVLYDMDELVVGQYVRMAGFKTFGYGHAGSKMNETIHVGLGMPSQKEEFKVWEYEK